MSGPALDDTDRGILYHLQSNGRQPITDIADDVGVADNTVRNRIARMKQDGVIQGYSVNIDYERAGAPHDHLLLCTAPVGERQPLAEAVRGIDGVVEVVTLMTGNWNVLVRAAGRQKDDITRLTHEIDDLGLRITSEHVVRAHTRHPFTGFDGTTP